MHIARSNPFNTYFIYYLVIKKKTLELLFTKLWKYTTQCASAALNANIVLSEMIFLLELKMRALLSVLNKDMMNTSFKLN